jgi:hypothetical protein
MKLSRSTKLFGTLLLLGGACGAEDVSLGVDPADTPAITGTTADGGTSAAPEAARPPELTPDAASAAADARPPVPPDAGAGAGPDGLPGCLEDTRTEASISEGIAGVVKLVDPDAPQVGGGRGVSYLVERELLVHDEARPGDAESLGGGFWQNVRTPLRATLRSERCGFYEVALPPGRYSVFVREGGRYYASRVAAGAVNPVTVPKGQVARLTIEITAPARP